MWRNLLLCTSTPTRNITMAPKVNKSKKTKTTKGKKRVRKHLEGSIERITAHAIRRLCHKSGISRIRGTVYDETRGILLLLLTSLLKDSTEYAKHSKRKMISVVDVVYAHKKQGRPLRGVVSA